MLDISSSLSKREVNARQNTYTRSEIYVNNSDTGVDVLDLLNRLKALEAAVSK